MDPVTIATVLTSVGSVVTGAVSWLGSFAGAIVSNPLILVFVALPIAGFGISALKRLTQV